jgi:hypothetical protein
MHENKQSVTVLRNKIGELIIQVLTDKILVREALLKFPPDITDVSTKCAYHALVHREADEDLRRRDIMYKDEQDNYLELVARTLIKGSELPKNIIKNYNKYYREIKINRSPWVKRFVKWLCKFLNV